MGFAVTVLGHWLLMVLEGDVAGRLNNAPVELWVLQPFVAGNLAVMLTWVWLDLRAARRNDEESDARFALCLLAVTVAVVSTFGGALWAGVLLRDFFLAGLLCVVAPVLVVAVPLLWFAARRIEPLRLRALVLAGFVAASTVVPGGSRAGEEVALRAFAMNSCLIGLAVAIWLLTWAAMPDTRRTA